jgi:hypothetical protein
MPVDLQELGDAIINATQFVAIDLLKKSHESEYHLVCCHTTGGRHTEQL